MPIFVRLGSTIPVFDSSIWWLETTSKKTDRQENSRGEREKSHIIKSRKAGLMGGEGGRKEGSKRNKRRSRK